MSTHAVQGHRASLPEFQTTFASEAIIWREAEWGGMRVGYETYLKDFDDADLLRGLPNDLCQCPHWGYLLVGRMTVRYSDHHEVFQTGDVYYMAPGHTLAVDAGTVLIEFSPKEDFRKVTEVAERNMARLAHAAMSRTEPDAGPRG